jgi:PAS domain S-box-containing protein
MGNRLRRWLNDLPIHDPVERQQALLLQIVLIGLIVSNIGTLPLTLIAPVETAIKLIALSDSTFLVLLAIAALGMLRRGRFHRSVLAATSGLLLGLAIVLILGGLPNSNPLLLGFVIPITLAGLLASRRALLLTVGLSTLIVSLTAILQHLSPPLAGFARLQDGITIITIGIFTLTVGLLGLFLDRFGASLRSALVTALAREQELERGRADLETRIVDLEREIAERWRVEAALRDSEERYRLLAENSSDLISLIDLDNGGRRVYASPSYRTVLGYDPAELIGASAFDLVHPDDLNSLTEQVSRIADQGTAQVIYRIRHADGSWRWMEVQAAAITRQGGQYAVAVGRDVTERVRLEEQVRQSQKMESIGRLAGGVAHDFNNLLTAIMGNLELALNTLPASQVIRDDLEEAQKAADRAAALTRQLLAFARRQAIEPRIINLNGLIGEMDKLLRRLIGEDIELVTLPTPDLGMIKADPGQIEQVIVNLAINARDAMPGGGKLTIETRNVALDRSSAQQHIDVTPGAYALLAVSDTGVGMDEETLRHVFEPFFTTKPKGKGTGLGLATCYGIVKQHGGHIWPYSELGHGSTFRIYLPQVAEPLEAHAAPYHPDAIPHGTETVLLAEDEASVRALAARVLRERGYVVLEASDGDEALRLASEHAAIPIDLLLTDVVMPRVSGKALVERVGALHPGIKVLYISGYADHAVVHHGRLDPGVDFLHKPFSPSTLARKVREVLDSADVQQ